MTPDEQLELVNQHHRESARYWKPKLLRAQRWAWVWFTLFSATIATLITMRMPL